SSGCGRTCATTSTPRPALSGSRATTSAPPRSSSTVSSPATKGALDERGLAPDLVRDLDDKAELRPLLLLGEVVPLGRRGEAALGREAELVEVDISRGLLDPPHDLLPRLELAVLGGDEAEHHLLPLRDEAQRLEAAGPLVVPFHEEAVDLELAE